MDVLKKISKNSSSQNAPTYLWSNICIGLCAIYIISFVGFMAPSILSNFNANFGSFLLPYMVLQYLISAFILPLPATAFGIYAIKYNIKYYTVFEDNSKTNKKNKTCIVLLLFVIPTAVFYCISALRM